MSEDADAIDYCQRCGYELTDGWAWVGDLVLCHRCVTELAGP